MNNNLHAHNRIQSAGNLWKTLASVIVCVALTATFWTATIPAAKAREADPLAAIQAKLPPGKTIANATPRELAAAVCAAVKSAKGDAPQIAKAAIHARPDLAGELAATAIRCAATGGQDPNCAATGQIVRAAIQGSPDSASTITDAALSVAPGCSEQIANAGRSSGGTDEEPGFENNTPGNINPPPGTVYGGGGGGFNPAADTVTFLLGGVPVTVPANQAANFAAANPTATRIGTGLNPAGQGGTKTFCLNGIPVTVANRDQGQFRKNNPTATKPDKDGRCPVTPT